MEQEFYRRHSMSEAKDENSSAKTSSAAARRSFFRRKHKHKHSGSKDGKELLALDTISTDSIPFLDDSVNLAYQRVQKVDCTSPRPVLILGPLLDAVKDMLVKESPGKFCRCPLEVMKASQQAIERGVKDCLFIDYKRRSGHFDVTTVASIKEITEKVLLSFSFSFYGSFTIGYMFPAVAKVVWACQLLTWETVWNHTKTYLNSLEKRQRTRRYKCGPFPSTFTFLYSGTPTDE
nr:disks large homolog 5-like [Zootoca vivipara]